MKEYYKDRYIYNIKYREEEHNYSIFIHNLEEACEMFKKLSSNFDLKNVRMERQKVLITLNNTEEYL